MPSTQNDISVDYVVFSTSKGDVWAQNIERGSHKIATGEEKTFQFKIFTIYGTEFTKIKVLDDTTTPGTELTFNTIYNGEKIIESRDMDNPYYIIIEDD